MRREEGWAPMPVCEACDDYKQAVYALPDTSGQISLVCQGHAAGWFDEDSKHLLPGARILASLEQGDIDHVLDASVEPMTRGSQ